GARHQPEFGRGDAGAAVVVRVEADHHAVAIADVPAEPFYLVGIDVRRRAFDCGGKVEDQRALGGRLEHIHHRLADLHREFE
nr:hypothetical protein [Tanacetum cinerariifolium]